MDECKYLDDEDEMSDTNDVNKDNTLNLDNVLDAEFIKAKIQDEEAEETDYGRIKFRFTCLNSMEYKAKREYSNTKNGIGGF